MERNERLKEEKTRIASLFVDLSRDQFLGLLGLIEQAAFLRITLDDLQESIADSGATDDYQNGANQSGTKISAELAAYNKTMRTYQKLMADLMKYIPYSNDFKIPGMNENEYIAFNRFRENEKYEFYLSDEFAAKLEDRRARAIERMLEGN